ncbi:serine/threonine protein kinase [Corynebacterium pacaense]|uniref:serine/threonine protein kinase n=1 Tax=Corynebacterium pacaense TaxID=1816684 RepID=UPI0009BC2B2C|nr:serine/threonine protein kinase [Corynebacterium pacaense]
MSDKDEDPGTEAVLFDPFADDEEEDGEDLSIFDDDNLGLLLHDLEGIRATQGQFRPDSGDTPTVTTAATAATPGPAPGADPSERSRRQAISLFRERRRVRRESRPVADGMVQLPFITPTPESELLIDPEAELKPGIEAPQLRAGDIVADQYEVLGVIAHGGMGWIYLANDRNVSGRIVVLKGMMSQASSQDQGTAVAEREFLADITHPGIVKAYNFIDDPRVPGGFIVMEYVNGPSLNDRRKKQPDGVLGLDLAIGYILEVLPAMEYLHSRGVVYNDLKPENVIVTEDQVKLIDLGAVTGIGAFGYIYGTRGFQAPEVSTEGPSVASDIYTIGRTLAALTLKMPVEDGQYKPGIPSPNSEPLLRRHLSYYRFLQRATATDPAARFSSVSELRTQLYGVLREILAVRDGRQYPAQHSLFSPQRSTFGTKHLVFRTDKIIDGIDRQVRITSPEIVAALPVPLIDRNDPGSRLLSGSSYAEPSETLESLRNAMKDERYADSIEIPLGVVRTLLDLGFTTEARAWLATLEERLGRDWRHHWFSGITYLLLDEYPIAQEHFNMVLTILPGESAPKLALAATDELLLQQGGFDNTALLTPEVAAATANLDQDFENLDSTTFEQLSDTWSHITHEPNVLRFQCLRLYALVWATNPTTVSSAFGLARQLMAENQIELAVSALDRLSPSSRHHRMATLTTILLLVSSNLSESRIRRAARRLEEIPTNEPRFNQIRIAVMSAGLTWLRESGLKAAASPNPLFEYPFSQKGLREGISAALRVQARSAPFARHRYALVDMANSVRPFTWF